MKYEVWYSVQNGGDGSAYPVFMESEKLSEIDQKYMDEGWGECCNGCLEIESDSPIRVKEMLTVDDAIKEVEDELNEDFMKSYKATGQYPGWFARLEGKLAALKALKGEEQEKCNQQKRAKSLK